MNDKINIKSVHNESSLLAKKIPESAKVKFSDRHSTILNCAQMFLKRD